MSAFPSRWCTGAESSARSVCFQSFGRTRGRRRDLQQFTHSFVLHGGITAREITYFVHCRIDFRSSTDTIVARFGAARRRKRRDDARKRRSDGGPSSSSSSFVGDHDRPFGEFLNDGKVARNRRKVPRLRKRKQREGQGVFGKHVKRVVRRERRT